VREGEREREKEKERGGEREEGNIMGSKATGGFFSF
jgi:hypothetical protein